MVGDDDDGRVIRSLLAEQGIGLIDSPRSAGTSRAISDSRTHGEPTYTFNAAAQHRRIQTRGSREREAIEKASLVAISCFPFDDQAGTRLPSWDPLSDSDAAVVIDANPRRGMLHDRSLFATTERLGPGAAG